MNHGIMPKEMCDSTEIHICADFFIKSRFIYLVCPYSTTYPSNKAKIFTETKMFITFLPSAQGLA